MSLSTRRAKSKISNLPKSPGVYEFRDKQGKILYIGKATSLKDRVGSYFLKNAHLDRPNIEPMVSQIADIKIHETDSVLEALILESNLIKKHQPKYNVMAKDDKSFGYFLITKEEFPRVLAVFKTQLGKYQAKNIYGPYMSKYQMETALKLIRKIFPFHSIKAKTEKGCLDFQIGRCPGPYAGAISKKDYLKNIHGIEMILQGKKKSLLTELKKQMKVFSKNNEFEKAGEARNRIFALEHIRDVALISEDIPVFGHPMSKRVIGCPLRIEAYDISNIGGDFAVGSMIVFQNNKPDKSQYRKFKIKTVSGIDDVAMMREVLLRRFKNNWPKPDLILLDGGKGHLNMAQSVLNDLKLDVPTIAVAKGPTRKKLDIYHGKEALVFQNIISDEKLVERIRNEAHRFAISYHKKLRNKSWKEK
ncbi:MAG: excinuclease ABC subunit UvrC [Candidatus Moranbacteria bacterium]|nr:excinuclease ABC subunit UvrC [Candidatus Moranbacteria bacterium]